MAAAIGRSQLFVSRRLRVYEDRILRNLVLSQRCPCRWRRSCWEPDPVNGRRWRVGRSRSKGLQAHARRGAWPYGGVHPRLREWVVGIRDLVANATLSTGEKRLLRELAEDITLQLVSHR